MALPVGATRLGEFKGLKGDTGVLADLDVDLLPWGEEAYAEMTGPAENRGAIVHIPMPLPGPETVNNDDATELLVLNPTKTGAAVATRAAAVARVTANYANDATAGNLRGLISKLDRGVADVTILWISDSLGNSTDEIPYLNALWLASQYPAYTVQAAFWDEVSETGYKTPVTIQTGTGVQTLRVWICAKSGSLPSYVLGSRYQAAVAAVTPDAVIVLHGHNTGGPVSTDSAIANQRLWFMELTESVTATHPFATLTLIAENPSLISGRATWQATKAQLIEQVASIRGYGFIDGHQVFLDYGPAWATDLMADDTHPNAVGSQLIADVLNAAMASAHGASAARLETSLLLRGARNYLSNPQFNAWTGTNPDNWGPTGATLSKDTTDYETGAQAMKVTGAASGGAQAWQALGAEIAHELRGEWVTLAVRARQPSSNTLALAANIADSVGSVNRRDMVPTARDGYVWMFASGRVNPAATQLYVRLYARLSGADAVEGTFDRAYLVKGALPLAGG